MFGRRLCNISGLLGPMALLFNSAFGDNMSSELNSPRHGAQFVRGVTTLANTFLIGPAGGEFEIRNLNKNIDGISVRVPSNAVTMQTKVSIGFNNGTFLPVRGEASGHIIVIDVQGLKSFQQAISVVVHKSKPTQKGIPLGFSVEDNDKIKIIDTVYDKNNGDITFYSFRPIMFTWIYTKF